MRSRCAARAGKWTRLGKRNVTVTPRCRLARGHKGMHYFEAFRDKGNLSWWSCDCKRTDRCYDGSKTRKQ